MKNPIQQYLEKKAFKLKLKKHKEQIDPYIQEYQNGSYILNVDAVIDAWENDWEIIHFSFRHLMLRGISTVFGDTLNIHPTSAKEIIKRLNLKKYDLFLQEGKKYRLREYRPRKGQYRKAV